VGVRVAPDPIRGYFFFFAAFFFATLHLTSLHGPAGGGEGLHPLPAVARHYFFFFFAAFFFATLYLTSLPLDCRRRAPDGVAATRAALLLLFLGRLLLGRHAFSPPFRPRAARPDSRRRQGQSTSA
jgi:hypothetical protein